MKWTPQKTIVVVRRRLVVEDVAELLEMAGPQEMLAIDEALLRQEGERPRVDFDDALALERGRSDEIAGQLAIGRRVRAVREDVVELKLGHAGIPLGDGAGCRAASVKGC